MVRQYPHYLFAVKCEIEAYKDGGGNWVQPDDATPEMVSMCREETNGKGTQIQVAGGTFHVFASLVQLPKGVPVVADGTTVFVSNDPDGMDVRIKGTALKFDNGQLHSRLWL